MPLLIAGLLVAAAAPLWAQPPVVVETTESEAEPYYFYHGRDLGSESMIHPLRLILNGGYGILQLDNRDANPWEIDYGRGLDIVWTNISDPFGSIQNDGWGKFITHEILPFSLDSSGGQYWPNYTLHLIGGGMSYRMMAEWFRWNEYSYPKLWAGTTLMTYHLLNEVVENFDVPKWTVDPVSDLLIFNPVGIWMFSHDGVARFFSETMHMTDWSYQIAYDVGEERWVNNGQNFAMKVDLPWFERWRFFYHMGTHAEVGVSWRVPNGDELSVGAGLIAKNLIPSDGNFRTVDLARSAGVWWDRDGSLLGSMDWAEGKGYRMRANLYPGPLSFGSFKPGVFGILHRDNDVTMGVSVSWLPVGIAERF